MSLTAFAPPPDFSRIFPVVSPAVALLLAERGWVEDRDYIVSPPLPRSWPEPGVKVEPSTVARMARPLTLAGAR